MPLDYLASLHADTSAISRAAASAGLEARIPSCPEWRLADLLSHLSELNEGVTEILRTGGPVDFAALGRVPTGDALLSAYAQSAARLIDALDALGVDQPTWNWFRVDPPCPGFYHRRMAVETTIHRWDAQGAAGDPDPIPPDLAADGIDEVFTVFLSHRPPDADLGGSLHLHATDSDSEWVIERVDGVLKPRRGHEKSTAAVRGPASDLLLYLWNRVDPIDLDVVGDADVTRRWRQVMPS